MSCKVLHSHQKEATGLLIKTEFHSLLKMVLLVWAFMKTGKDQNNTLALTFNLEQLCWISPKLLKVPFESHKKTHYFAQI